MPVYEYLCEECDGVFESVKAIREAEEPAPCPVCDTEGKRVMPSQFTAFIMRGGYPRRIPDKGTFWHLGKEVSYLPSSAKAWEHPEINKPQPKAPLGKQDYVDLVDQKIADRRTKREEQRRKREWVKDREGRKGMDLPPRPDSRKD